jgi:hypothetical protein
MNVSKLILILMICSLSQGCEMGRTWFSMSSDSPMPWFGFDIPFPRRTSQLSPQSLSPEHLTRERLHGDRSGSSLNNDNIKTVKQNSSTSSKRLFIKELDLPSIPPLFNQTRGQVSDLSYHGPAGTFSGP